MELQELGVVTPTGPQTNIQAAINAAKTSPGAAVWIPAWYTGSDSVPATPGVPVFDMRGSAGTFTGGSLSSQVGTFTGPSFTPNQAVLTGSISPCTAANEYTQIGQPGFTVDSLDGVVCVPVGSTDHQANGVGGYTQTFSTSTNAVGVYGSGRCLGNSSFCWGMNPIASDAAGVVGASIVGEEVDINVLGSPTLAVGIWVNGLQGGGSVLPANSTGIRQQLGFNYGVRSGGLNATFTAENGPITLNYGSADSLLLLPTQVLLGSDLSGNLYIDQTGSTKFAGTVGSLLPPAGAAPSASLLVTANAQNVTTLTSPPFTATSYTTWIVAIQSFNNSANSVTSVTDKFRTPAYKIGSQALGGRDVELWIFPCIANANIVNHPDQIIVTQSPAAFILFSAWAVSNPNCAIPMNNASVQFATNTSTAAAVPTITTQTPNEIVMSAIFMSAQQACTQGAGYTLDSSTTNFCLQHQTFASTGATTTAPATFASTQWWEATVSLQTVQQLGSQQNPWPIETADRIQQSAANNDKAGVVTCAGNTVTKTFANPYVSTPVIFVSDETTAGGARVSAKSASAFTVTCTGATDVVDYIVMGNPN